MKPVNVLPPCKYAKSCGGCTYQGLSYKEQTEKKQQEIEKLLKPFGKPERMRKAVNPYHYRNKVHAVFGVNKGKIISGIYEEKSHKIVPVEECQIEDERAGKIIGTIRDLLVSFKIKPYREDTGYGLFRHVLIRTGRHTGQILVVLVVGDPVFPSKKNFTKELVRLHPEITSVVMNINGRKTSMILGEKQTTLYGKGYIEDTLCGKVFRISPKSFYQVNTEQTEVLYGLAMQYAHLTGTERVVDAYCGIGTIGLIASDGAGEVMGVENNPEAFGDALVNAKGNKVKNIHFWKEDAGDFLQKLAAQGEKIQVLFMDPPRSGSSVEFLSAVGKIAPEKVIYISCNPVTLARDLQQLKEEGYRAEKIQPVDLFPFTNHVETIVGLKRRDR